MAILINQNETETEQTLVNKLSSACHVQPCFQSAAVVQAEERPHNISMGSVQSLLKSMGKWLFMLGPVYMNDEMIAFGMLKIAKIFVLSFSMLP